jgi:hypothetical protein
LVTLGSGSNAALYLSPDRSAGLTKASELPGRPAVTKVTEPQGGRKILAEHVEQVTTN